MALGFLRYYCQAILDVDIQGTCDEEAPAEGVGWGTHAGSIGLQMIPAPRPVNCT